MCTSSPRSKPHATSHLTAIESLFGPLPPGDVHVDVQLAHQLDRPDHALSIWRVTAGTPPGVSWFLHIAWPRRVETCPVLLSPDGCWPHVVSETALQVTLNEGVALAWFNRTELAYDRPDGLRLGPVHTNWPDTDWSAIGIWAWGIHRSVDALQGILGPRATHLGVIGHSRGGKAALVAGALDERLQATIAHNSGTGGAASLQNPPRGAETLGQLQATFPHWVRPEVACMQTQTAIVHQNAPLHWLQAIAPRGLCLLQAEDDLWANPVGTRHMFDLLQPTWRACPDQLEWHSHSGGHAITPADWQRAARFVQSVGGGDTQSAHRQP
jgi:dienelactone hydrolase